MLKILPVLTKTFAFRSRQKIIVTLIPGKIYSFPLIRPRNNKILYIKLPFYIIMTKEIQKYEDHILILTLFEIRFDKYTGILKFFLKL